MSKKILALISTLTIIVLSLTGCNNNTPEGIYNCNNLEGHTIKIKIDNQYWDITNPKNNNKWFIEEIKKDQKNKSNTNSETFNTIVKFNDNSKSYILNFIYTKNGKEIENSNVIKFKYDKDNNNLLLYEKMDQKVNTICKNIK